MTHLAKTSIKKRCEIFNKKGKQKLLKPTSQWSNFRASTASVKFHLESATKWILSRISSVTKLDFLLSQDFLCHGIWMGNTCVFLIFKHLHFLIDQPAPGPRLTFLRELFLLKIPQKSNFYLFTGMIFTGITVKVNFEICQSSVIDCKQSSL